ncbi:MAG TPA: hypothetical protein VFH78_16210 [Candidatus Thermoplasmatota archaeon]|nr:hypothetical protein [Candidatus Thermoplasmatota archaeon]
MADEKRQGAEEQEDVLDHKDHVLEGKRGLQQYGEEAFPDGGMRGTGGMGTAERSAKIGAAQRAAAEASKKRPEGE